VIQKVNAVSVHLHNERIVANGATVDRRTGRVKTTGLEREQVVVALEHDRLCLAANHKEIVPLANVIGGLIVEHLVGIRAAHGPDIV